MKTIIKTTLFLLFLLLFQSCIVKKEFFKAFDIKQRQFIMIDSVLVERQGCKNCEKDYFLNVFQTDDDVVNVVNNHIEGVQEFYIDNKCRYVLIVGKVHNDREVIKNITKIISSKKPPY